MGKILSQWRSLESQESHNVLLTSLGWNVFKFILYLLWCSFTGAKISQNTFDLHKRTEEMESIKLHACQNNFYMDPTSVVMSWFRRINDFISFYYYYLLKVRKSDPWRLSAFVQTITTTTTKNVQRTLTNKYMPRICKIFLNTSVWLWMLFQC